MQQGHYANGVCLYTISVSAGVVLISRPNDYRTIQGKHS